MHRVIIMIFVLVLCISGVFSGSAQAFLGTHSYLKTPFFSNVDVLIDVGHGGVDSGTLHGELYEKDINLKISKLTYEMMKKRGIRVLVNRMDDYALSGENLWLR